MKSIDLFRQAANGDLYSVVTKLQRRRRATSSPSRSAALIVLFLTLEVATTSYAAEWKVPARAAQAPNPVPSNSASIEAGRRIWVRECVDCHGDQGKGNGPGAARLDEPVPDLHDALIVAQSDGALFFKVKAGRRPMPGYRGMLSDEDTWHVVNHMRRLIGRGPAPVKKAAPAIAIADAPAEPPARSSEANAVATRTSTAAEPRLDLTAAPSAPANERAETSSAAVVAAEALEGPLEELRQAVENVENDLHPGTFELLIAGTAAATWTYGVPTDPRADPTNSFNAVLSPHFYWKIADDFLIESHLDVRLAPEGTELNLEFAHLAYAFNRWLILGAGKIVTPFGLFQDRIHTSWVNRLPTEPLIVRDPGGIVPKHDIGVTWRGVLDLIVADNRELTSIDYAFYVANGPQLITPDPEVMHAAENARVGELDDDHFLDNNRNKAVGGRVGWRIIPELEIGGSGQWSRVGPSRTEYSRARAVLLGADLHYASALEPIAGTVLVEAEYARSSVTAKDYGHYHFDNERQGFYALLSYSPNTLPVAVLRNFEIVGRYDYLTAPDGAPQQARRGFSVGLNYWLSSTIVLKTAHSWTRIAGSGDAAQQFIAQLTAGL